RSAAKLVCKKRPFAIQLSSGDVVHARSVVVASGAQYRKLPLARLEEFESAGVYYAASKMEATLCRDDEVIVVGGGNSAGQAATFLAGTEKRLVKNEETGKLEERSVPLTKHVHMLVRPTGLPDSMSRYLMDRIKRHDRITLHTCTEIEALEGEKHLERVRWRNSATGEVETRPIRHVFSMTGAVPNTVWVGSCLAMDDKGFVKAGT